MWCLGTVLWIATEPANFFFPSKILQIELTSNSRSYSQPFKDKLGGRDKYEIRQYLRETAERHRLGRGGGGSAKAFRISLFEFSGGPRILLPEFQMLGVI